MGTEVPGVDRRHVPPLIQRLAGDAHVPPGSCGVPVGTMLPLFGCHRTGTVRVERGRHNHSPHEIEFTALSQSEDTAARPTR